jgi:hypothetical protein
MAGGVVVFCVSRWPTDGRVPNMLSISAHNGFAAPSDHLLAATKILS